MTIPDRPTLGAIALLYAAVLLGGASAAGFMGNLLLQFGCLAALALTLWRPSRHWPSEAAHLILIAFGLLIWIGLTLVPLPPAIWTMLPGREDVVRGFALLGLPLPWLPLSLAPLKTVASVVWVLPPLAMFALVVRLSARDRTRVTIALLCVIAASALLGLLQLLQGEASPLRLYAYTSTNRAVGFFANGNFLVTLLLCALPLAGAVHAEVVTQTPRRLSSRTWAIILSSLGALCSLGVAMNGSVAGYLLLIPTVAVSLIIARGYVPPWLKLRVVLLVVIGGLAAFASMVSLASSASRLGTEFSDDRVSRKTMALTSLEVIADGFPVGTGLGSFQQAYRSREDIGRATTIYVNHAHNDYLEAALELGVPGVAAILLFIAWWYRRLKGAWRSAAAGPPHLGRGASVAVGIVLIHSLVDFPARTAAISAVVAFACALLVPAPADRRTKRSRKRNGDRELSLGDYSGVNT